MRLGLIDWPIGQLGPSSEEDIISGALADSWVKLAHHGKYPLLGDPFFQVLDIYAAKREKLPIVDTNVQHLRGSNKRQASSERPHNLTAIGLDL